MTGKIFNLVAILGWTVLGLFICWTIYLYAADKPVSRSLEGAGCMYSERPLKNGVCDNSDPACPETIKTDGGNCGPEVYSPDVNGVNTTELEEVQGK